jgi:hypothetical protein
MNGPLVVVAASARALVECLRRAGLPEGGAPLLAVDAFGDDDLRIAADGHLRLALPRLRSAEGVLDAVNTLLTGPRAVALSTRAGVPSAAAQVMLGGGLDGVPQVVRAIAGQHRLLNASADAWAAARDPLVFHRLGIESPPTRLTPPEGLRGWLCKDTAGSAGLAVRRVGEIAGDRAVPSGTGVYWQRRVAGVPVSLLFCAHSGGIVPVGINRQWCSAVPGLPFAFGGVASAFDAGARVHDALVAAATRITVATGLRGLASLDAVLDRRGRVAMLEVNPRPTASVELYDRSAPGLLALHVAAVQGRSLPDWRSAGGSRALALLRAPVALRAGPRPPGVSDWREGAPVARGEPLCTLHASGDDTRQAMRRVRAAAIRFKCRLLQSVYVAAPDGEGFPYNPSEP